MIVFVKYLNTMTLFATLDIDEEMLGDDAPEGWKRANKAETLRSQMVEPAFRATTEYLGYTITMWSILEN